MWFLLSGNVRDASRSGGVAIQWLVKRPIGEVGPSDRLDQVNDVRIYVDMVLLMLSLLGNHEMLGRGSVQNAAKPWYSRNSENCAKGSFDSEAVAMEYLFLFKSVFLGLPRARS
jgi:hypothetical protein